MRWKSGTKGASGGPAFINARLFTTWRINLPADGYSDTVVANLRVGNRSTFAILPDRLNLPTGPITLD